MKFERTQVMNFEGAFRGMRNPMNSWGKGDSDFGIYCEHEDSSYYIGEVAYMWADHELENTTFDTEDNYDKEHARIVEERTEWLLENGVRYMQADHHASLDLIGPNDMNLARRLITGGTEHRKFLRQIFVSVDITAPLYWWKEFDTYKVGTTANSTSTMHKLASTPITLDCFETDDLSDMGFTPNLQEWTNTVVNGCEALRQKYNETKDKRYWKELIRWLPNGWLQTRTVTMNYENLRSMYHQRKHHKLTEWSEAFCEWVESLPYAKELIVE